MARSHKKSKPYLEGVWPPPLGQLTASVTALLSSKPQSAWGLEEWQAWATALEVEGHALALEIVKLRAGCSFPPLQPTPDVHAQRKPKRRGRPENPLINKEVLLLFANRFREQAETEGIGIASAVREHVQKLMPGAIETKRNRVTERITRLVYDSLTRNKVSGNPTNE